LYPRLKVRVHPVKKNSTLEGLKKAGPETKKKHAVAPWEKTLVPYEENKSAFWVEKSLP